ncbi:MAG TPA: lysine 5,6-aminomutase subunit alpha [Candidatus Saccharimonadales bacterium]|nr:lysine 5,6-aminomutase subunit alpha [Candidatus Saccharimonadales bacterium]
MSESPWGPLDRLVALSDTLAGAWGARARACTTIGTERAILRLCGVNGVDRSGRPLAGEVAERYLAGHHDRLGAGILLPFAMAMLEYDMGAQDVALDAASGAIDLMLEEDLLRTPHQRARAEIEARRLVAAAFDRIDANRTARRELLDVLGESPQPWFGSTLSAPALDIGRGEALRLIDAGADLIRIAIPAGRELVASIGEAGSGLGSGADRAGPGAPLGPPRDRFSSGAHRFPGDDAPAGSQRGLAELRRIVDEAGAERRRYVRLATIGPALSAPEQAVVAAFERVDVVDVDPIVEIVGEGVDPDRALADHAFAHRLLRRAGATVLIGAGPLVVAPDLARGRPSEPATRAGSALALQLLSAALARADGLSDEQIVVGAMPGWLLEERDPTIQAIAQVALRRALFPVNGLAFDEPPASTASEGWPFVFAAAVPGSEPTALVLRRAEPERVRQVGEATRAASRVGREVSSAFGARPLHGPALAHARAVVAAAQSLLERLSDEGWQAVLGAAVGPSDRYLLAHDTVAERSDDFDPLSLEQPTVRGA